MTEQAVVIRRVLRERRDRVFRAWTQPELMVRWFFPGEDWTATVHSDLRVGGKWEVLMRSATGEPHRQFGEYREISPNSRLVFTWSCPALAVDDSVVTVDLIERGAHTELVLTHELPPDPKIHAAHEEGWQGCLQNLERFCSNEEGNGK